MAAGELFVTIIGTLMTRKLFVGSLGFIRPSVLHMMPIMVKEVAPYGWMMCNAWVMKALLRNVSTEDGVMRIVVIATMHQ